MSLNDPLEDFSHWQPPSAEELGRQTPGYTVERLLARGGMAAVYVARQQSLDRQVALKVLPPELGHVPGFNEQFAGEARVLAKLQHPAVVTVIDFGHTETGSAFIVMELVEGLPLEQWGAGRTFAEKLDVAIRLTQGVAYFHQQGVIHADLKPDNIFVTTKGEVKILDFGLATPFLDAGEVEAPRFGTPPYTAPEAYDPQARPDPRSDTYSLGQTLVEFFGPGKLPPTAPGEAPEVARHLGRRDLAAVLEPMVRLDPDARPATLDHALAGLRALGHPTAPVRAPLPTSSLPRAGGASATTRKKKGGPPWFAVAAGLLAVIGAVVVMRHQSSPPESPAPVATVETTPPPAETEDASASATPAEVVAETPSPVPPGEDPSPSTAPAPVAQTPEPAPSSTTAPPDPVPAPPPANPALAGLREKFLAALQREKSRATQASNLTLAAAWTAEAERFAREHDVPETDPPGLTAEVARLRTIFRTEKARLPQPTATVTATGSGVTPGEPEPFSFPDLESSTPPPSSPSSPQTAQPTNASTLPKATLTIWWQCDDRSELRLNGDVIEGRVAKAASSKAATIWQADVAFSTGDVLAFKLRNEGGPRHFVALAKAGARLLFVSDNKWQVLDSDPSSEWWTGKDRTGTPARRVNAKDYTSQFVRDFCAFTQVSQGSVTVCWGEDPLRTHIRRVLTSFDFQTARASLAR